MDVNTLLNFITILLIVPAGFFVKRILSEFDDHRKTAVKYQEDTTKEMSSIKSNYLDRFENLSVNLSQTKEQLTKSINDSEKNLTKLITDHLTKGV